MIPRYSRPQMVGIWDPQTRYRIWFEIEAHAADAMAELGMIPKAAAEAIWTKGNAAKFDIDRIDAIEREVKHDVVAFLTHLAELIGPQARFVHQGMTSSDVLDTCFNVQLVRASDLLIGDIELGGVALGPDCLGRIHRDHAELGHGIGGMRLDLEPDAVARLGIPDRYHLWPAVARDHYAASPRAIAAVPRSAAMLAR